MAKGINCLSNSLCMVGDGIKFFCLGLELLDESVSHVDAIFSIDTDETDIPMVGITPYGMVIGQVTSDTMDLEVTIVADDGTEQTTVTLPIADLADTIVGTSLNDGGGGK